MKDLLAFLTIVVWPVIPLFWVPVHLFPAFFRRVGLLTYALPFLLWLPAAYVIYANRAFLLQFRTLLPPPVEIAGLVLLLLGLLLQLWTGRLLGLPGLMGLPEISLKMKKGLVTDGAFSVVRHPTYLSHDMIFFGVFLATGVIAVAIVTLLDFVVVNGVIIPLEEKELGMRFGEEYDEYKRRVPRFVPCLKW